MSNGPTLKMKKRLRYVVVIAILLAFIVLIGSLVRISVVQYDFYIGKANNQQLRPEKITASRGSIYDRNMQVLAQSATVWDVTISPMDITGDTDAEVAAKKELIANGLAEILEVDKSKILEKMEKKNQYEVIKAKVEKDIQEQVLKFMEDNSLTNEINLVESTKRYYPNGTLAASVIGFSGTDEGLAGLEAKYNKELSGTPGYVVSLKDGLSKNMMDSYEEKYDPINGNSLVLTLDETVQSFVEKALDQVMAQHNPKKGCCAIVMNVNTGEILAMANRPTFDLNEPFTIYDQASAEAIAALPEEEQKAARGEAQQAQWNNKAISYAYQPGSTFKTIVASSALEEKVVSLNSTFYCGNSIKVEDRTMKCHIYPRAHGSLNLTEALVNSCNPSFVQIGQKLGGTMFYKYFKSFGLTERTGIDLPGEGDSIYYTEKQLNSSIVSLSSCSFGQSMALTPIQMITAVSAVVNGGNLVTPHVVKDVLDENGNVVRSVQTEVKRQVISEETSATVRGMMEEVVTAKSGVNAAVKGYRIGGKSGTSQKQNPGDSEDARIGSYIAVAPIDDPEIAVLVMIDEPQSGEIYGSVIAAPPAASILADTLPYLGFSPKYTAEELAAMETTVPLLVDKGVLEAESKLAASGLGKPKVVGDGNTVIKQVPTAGSKIPKDGTVIIYTDDTQEKTVTVPNVIGLSPKLAKQKLEQLQLNVVLHGADGDLSKITVQSLEPETEVPIGTVIEITGVRSDTD